MMRVITIMILVSMLVGCTTLITLDYTSTLHIGDSNITRDKIK